MSAQCVGGANECAFLVQNSSTVVMAATQKHEPQRVARNEITERTRCNRGAMSNMLPRVINSSSKASVERSSLFLRVVACLCC